MIDRGIKRRYYLSNPVDVKLSFMNTHICRMVKRIILDHILTSVPRNVFEVPLGLSVTYIIHMLYVSKIIF